MRTTTLAQTEGRVAQLLDRYRAVRARTLRWIEPLTEEDCVAQSMTEASPAKWNLAHTTWFFEEFVLAQADPGYRRFHPRYSYLFNSYYEAVGVRHARQARGLLTRPSLDEVRTYRAHVDQAVAAWLAGGAAVDTERLGLLELGLNHEEQHQELLLTDVKHLFAQNPLEPAYRPRGGDVGASTTRPAPAGFVAFEEGSHAIGHDPRDGFAFDNEGPRHRVHLGAFQLAPRPVTNAEFAEFVDSGGYADVRHWLSDGWDWVRSTGVEAPLYWRREDAGWSAFTLAGRLPLALDEPVCHVSFYEADAYARFRDARLPTEAEWEVAAGATPDALDRGHFADSERFHPRPVASADGAAPGAGLAGLFGDVWEWTASPYVAYPGFRAAAGALGEYNGKFMCNQIVLRGGSCLTPPGHVRATYRNFFPAGARWQVSGLRLARDPR
jgi:ergothioneine biosynthesis protein EgtB